MMRPPHVVAIIQARMGSSRLPAKVMKSVAGRPMIDHVIQRARNISGVHQVVVATSKNAAEGPLVEHVSSMPEVALFRGPEDDVLTRYYEAAAAFEADIVMRITGDCPLLSPRTSTHVLEAYLKNRTLCDYVSNTLRRTFPRGLDTSVMGFDTLERAHKQATTRAQREHVTVVIWSNPKQFNLLNIYDRRDRHHHRWTVDTAEDLELVRKIYDALSHGSNIFEYDEVLKLLERHPQWQKINSHIPQKGP